MRLSGREVGKETREKQDDASDKRCFPIRVCSTDMYVCSLGMRANPKYSDAIVESERSRGVAKFPRVERDLPGRVIAQQSRLKYDLRATAHLQFS